MANEEKTSLIDKAKNLFVDFKEHWNTPAEGNYVPYKEYKDVVIGVGANYAGSKTLEYIGFWSSCFLIMHHYKVTVFNVLRYRSFEYAFRLCFRTYLVVRLR